MSISISVDQRTITFKIIGVPELEIPVSRAKNGSLEWLTIWKYDHMIIWHIWHVMCHMSHKSYQMSGLSFIICHFMFHMSCLTCHIWNVMLCVTCNVISHVSCLTCLLCHFSPCHVSMFLISCIVSHARSCLTCYIMSYFVSVMLSLTMSHMSSLLYFMSCHDSHVMFQHCLTFYVMSHMPSCLTCQVLSHMLYRVMSHMYVMSCLTMSHIR